MANKQACVTSLWDKAILPDIIWELVPKKKRTFFMLVYFIISSKFQSDHSCQVRTTACV